MQTNDHSKQEKSKPEESKLPFEVPVEGSLGLLALGAVGIKAWREKKKSVIQNVKPGKNE